jgi:hypothetical protein
VFYDITDEATVEVLAIISKTEAQRWLDEHGTPGGEPPPSSDAPGGAGGGEG